MTKETPEAISANTELYNREATGQLSSRLGFVGDFLRTVNIVQIQQNVVVTDQASVIDALDALPAKLQRRALVTAYEAILNCYRSYNDHKIFQMLLRTIELCNEKAPEFQLGLTDELQAIDPARNDWSYKQNFEAELEQLKAASQSYAAILSLGFHALTICSPTTAARETVILGQIDAALNELRKKLQQTLVPNGRVKGSLLLSTLIDPGDGRFCRYLRHHGIYDGAAGFQLLISNANEAQYPRTQGVLISSCQPPEQYALLADTLIELIECFESLRKARLDYSPDVVAEGPAEPSATLTVDKSASGN